MKSFIITDYMPAIIFVCLICLILLALFVSSLIAILRIDSNLKKLIDLEYKKYKEAHGKIEDVSIDKS